MIKLNYNSTKNADMLYAIKADIHDPFFCLDLEDKSLIFLDHREYGAFLEKNNNPRLQAVLLTELLQKVAETKTSEPVSFKLIWEIITQYNLVQKTIYVPNSFPLDMADYLRGQKIDLVVLDPFNPQRTIKNETEKNNIKNNLKLTQQAFWAIEQILEKSKIVNDKIIYNEQLLTSELLKKQVAKILLDNDLYNSEGIIISSGTQSAMPHHSGYGAILPHQPIICDIFPRSAVNGYFADMTRTYFKGEPTREMIRIYQTVKDVQEKIIKEISIGKSGQQLYQLNCEEFLSAGFDVGDKGFIHGTGHGLGVEIHEAPYLNAVSKNQLESGHIFTVEPGLYYPELGGVRIEDVIYLGKNGVENLTDYPKELQIF